MSCAAFGFASVQLRGDWERSIVRSIDGEMAREEEGMFIEVTVKGHEPS